MASASCSWTVYIGLRRARHWAKIRSSGTLSKPEGVRNPLTLDEPRRPQDVLRSSQRTSWSGLRSNSIPRTDPHLWSGDGGVQRISQHIFGEAVMDYRYCRLPLIFSRPDWAQASSLSPPGAPLTPIAAIVSLPTWMGRPPTAVTSC